MDEDKQIENNEEKVESTVATEQTAEEGESNNEETKKIKKGDIVWWIFFVLFLLPTIAAFKNANWLPFGRDLLITLLCMPTIDHWLESKNCKISTRMRIIIIIILMFLPGIYVGSQGMKLN